MSGFQQILKTHQRQRNKKRGKSRQQKPSLRGPGCWTCQTDFQSSYSKFVQRTKGNFEERKEESRMVLYYNKEY